METAPHDGSRVWLLIHHPNWEIAGAHDRERWEETVTGTWIDHNGGGFTWNGIYGHPQGWKPLNE